MPVEQKLLVEPITRPDGISFIIVLEDESVIVDVEQTCFAYDKEEIERLGSGDFQTGLARLGQSVFTADRSELNKPGTPRLYFEELGR